MAGQKSLSCLEEGYLEQSGELRRYDKVVAPEKQLLWVQMLGSLASVRAWFLQDRC